MTALALIGSAANASAHRVTYIVEPEINSSSGYDSTTGLYDWVGGDLESNHGACSRGRVVSLFNEAGTLIATTTTNADAHGTWRIYASPSAALPYTSRYYLTSQRVVLRRSGHHRHECGAGRSRTDFLP